MAHKRDMLETSKLEEKGNDGRFGQPLDNRALQVFGDDKGQQTTSDLPQFKKEQLEL